MKYTILLLFFSFFTYDLNGQIIDLEKVAQRTQRKIERRAQRKVDQAVDDGLDEVEGKKKKKRKKYKDEKYESSKTSKSSKSKVDKDDYELPINKFKGKLMISITKTSTSGNEEVFTFKYISKESSSILIPMTPYKSIDFVQLNNKNKSIIVAKTNDGKKNGTKDYFKYFDKPDNIAYTTAKTDDTDMINGLICRKYILESQNATVTNWSTMELGLDYPKFLMELNYLELIEDQLSGLNPSPIAVMDAEIEKMNGEELIVQITEIEEGHFDFSNYDISDYSLLDYTEY